MKNTIVEELSTTILQEFFLLKSIELFISQCKKNPHNKRIVCSAWRLSDPESVWFQWGWMWCDVIYFECEVIKQIHEGKEDNEMT